LQLGVAAAAGLELLLAGAQAAPSPAAAAPGRALVLDDMTDPGLWRAGGSDGVATSLEGVAGPAGAALRLRFDFKGHAGYAFLERPLPLDLPENFDVDVELGGDAPINDLEVKFIDASGDNVWWYRRTDFDFRRERAPLHIRRRQIEFAWGPTPDRRLHHIERLQVVVNAGRGAGHGSVDVGAVTLTPRAPPPAVWPAATVTTDGASRPAPDGNPAHVWRCRPAPSVVCELTIDWQLPREFGGIRLDWDPQARSARYTVETSLDGIAWQLARRVEAGAGPRDLLWLPESEARYLRLRLGAADGALELRALQLKEPGFGESRNALLAEAAGEAARSAYPRGFTQQTYWTLVGSDGGSHSGLLSEDGALETDRAGPSLEPFVVEDGHWYGWADVSITQSLEQGSLPLPSVAWTSPHWSLEVAAAAATGTDAGLFGRYRLRNLTGEPRHLRLLVALRPLQVNPPAQFLTTPGGAAPLARLTWDGAELRADAATRVRPLQRPDRVLLIPFERGDLPETLRGDWGDAPERPLALEDPAALATAVLGFDVDLPPRGERTVGLFVPWATGANPAGIERLASTFREARVAWKARLGRVHIDAPDSPEASDLAAAMQTAEAHILMSRAGPMLRPGTRAYARSWIRDGAMMSAGLLRLGETRAPEDYLRWYAGYLFADGKVPCCVDARGADPVPEHDSAGEFLFLAAEIHRLGGDRELIAQLWPQLRAAAAYLERLRQTERPAQGPQGATAAFYGLMPPSISHEGYSAKPMHSYWDDFWALRGWTDAVYLAAALGHADDARRLQGQRDEFAADLAASITRVAAQRGINFIPGAADLGDFDATSTTIALSPGVGAFAWPDSLLQNTFERYWREFVARRDGTRAWQDYTPYEWRNVGAFVRLAWRDRALAALRYFMADRKPPAWNQWPEVIGREPRTARFIGDLPHGWVASDFLRSALDLFAYEDPAGQSVVLAAGVARAWLAGRGLRVRAIRTRFGPVSYRLRERAGRLELELPAGIAVPPGGFAFSIPAAAPDGVAQIDGVPTPYHGGTVLLRSAPCRVTIP
jgi:hypothetical protein